MRRMIGLLVTFAALGMSNPVVPISGGGIYTWSNQGFTLDVEGSGTNGTDTVSFWSRDAEDLSLGPNSGLPTYLSPFRYAVGQATINDLTATSWIPPNYSQGFSFVLGEGTGRLTIGVVEVNLDSAIRWGEIVHGTDFMSATFKIVPDPEPVTALLVLAGMAALCWMRLTGASASPRSPAGKSPESYT